MATREEIGIADRLCSFLDCKNDEAEYCATQLIKYLHFENLVRRVKCPDCAWSQFVDEAVGMSPCLSCNSTGYIIEPLIKEESSG